jgi:HAD superfamily hydrolase (TIGR01509 family)
MILFEEILNIAAKLKQNGHMLAIVSNHVDFWFNEIRRKYPQMFKIFDGVVVVSCYSHCAKPDLSIYQFTLEELKKKTGHNHLTPQNCIFIDDKTRNTKTAEEFGFKTITFNAEKQTASELINAFKKFGVEI